MKLTEAQTTALGKLPCSITMWGGKPWAGMPKGIRNLSTLWALHKLGLAAITYQGTTETWRITDAGRRALQEKDQ